MIAQPFTERLLARARDAGIDMPPGAAEKLDAYTELLAQWTRSINLTGFRLDAISDTAIDRLLLEPLAAAAPIEAFVGPVVSAWFDLGSGGGSPAIPLKIVRPDWTLTMVESKAKKAAFLREAVRTLRLANVTVENQRFEGLMGPAAAELVTVRAVRGDATLAAAVRRILRPSGVLAVFGRGPTEIAGFIAERVVQLPSGDATVTLLRVVPRGTQPADDPTGG